MPRDRGPDIRVPPPALFVAPFLVALWLDGAAVSLPLSRWLPSGGLALAGAAATIAGTVVGVWGATTFLRAGAPVVPVRPTATLVTRGPYRFTRNPMYLGLTLAYAGLSLLLDTAWPLLLVPVPLALVQRLVIRREERYLREAFGAEYDAYTSRVRRWL